MIENYQPSGRFNPVAIAYILIGLVVAVVAAYVYQLLLHWIPFIYITFLITGGLGLLLAMVGSFIVTQGHIRNVLLGISIGVLLTVTALGSKYYFQYRQLLGDATTQIMSEEGIAEAQRSEVRSELAKDLTFWRHIEFRVQEGWQIGRRGNGAPVGGWFVYLVWLIELGIVGWLAIGGPRSAAGHPYSEKLSQWANEEETVMTLPITNEEMVAKITAASSIDDLLEIPIPQTDESNQFAVYRVNSIPGEEMEDAYLSVDLLTISIDKDGEQKTDTNSLVANAVFSSEQRHRLVENAELLSEAMVEYRESLNEEADELDEDDAARDEEIA